MAIMRGYLGWDCANKTLAWAGVKLDVDIYKKVAARIDVIIDLLFGPNWHKTRSVAAAGKQIGPVWSNAAPDVKAAVSRELAQINSIISGFFVLTDYGVCDVLNGRKVSELSDYERSVALHKFLSSDRVKVESVEKVLIEHQPIKISQGQFGAKINVANIAVEYQLMYHYIDYRPEFVDPRLKNKFAFGDGLDFDTYLARYTALRKDKKDARYAARKAHSADNFVRLLELVGQKVDVPKALINHVADAALEILAYAMVHDIER